MNDDLISRSALKEKLQARCDYGYEDFDKGYNIGIKAAIDLIDNAPTIDVSYDLYREETCDRKTHCYDYKYWHCIGCNGCKRKEADNEETNNHL